MSKKVSEVKKINSGNFMQAVAYTKEINRKVRCHLRVRGIATTIGCALFLFLSLVLTFGFLSAVDASYSTVIAQKLPFVSEWWKDITIFLNGITTEWYLQILICLGFLYLIPFIASSVIAVLIIVFTKVKDPSMEGDHVKQVNSLYDYCCKIPCPKKQDWRFNAICTRIITIFFVLTLIAYEIYALVTADGFLIILYFSIPIYFVYGLLCKLFILTLKPYYIEGYYVNTSAGSDAILYSYTISEYRKKVDPVIRARFEQYEREKREEAATAEKRKRETEAKIAEAYLNGWRPKEPEEPKPYSAMDDDMDLPHIDVSDM